MRETRPSLWALVRLAAVTVPDALPLEREVSVFDAPLRPMLLSPDAELIEHDHE